MQVFRARTTVSKCVGYLCMTSTSLELFTFDNKCHGWVGERMICISLIHRKVLLSKNYFKFQSAFPLFPLFLNGRDIQDTITIHGCTSGETERRLQLQVLTHDVIAVPYLSLRCELLQSSKQKREYHETQSVWSAGEELLSFWSSCYRQMEHHSSYLLSDIWRI